MTDDSRPPYADAASLDEDDTIGAVLARRADAARVEMEAVTVRLQDSRARLRETSRLLGTGRSARERLHESQLARLLARLETMPVIEQAKGVLIAQTGCDAEQAFNMLRSASQRANVPVRDLAADIIERASGKVPAPREPGSRS